MVPLLDKTCAVLIESVLYFLCWCSKTKVGDVCTQAILMIFVFLFYSGWERMFAPPSKWRVPRLLRILCVTGVWGGSTSGRP